MTLTAALSTTHLLRLLSLIAAGASLGIAGCATRHRDVTLPRIDQQETVWQGEVRRDSTIRMVVRDANTWRTLWLHTSNRQFPLPVPAIDFERDLLVVAVGGRVFVPGDSLAIDSIWLQNDTLVARVTSRHFCQPLMALLQMGHVVRMPRSGHAVRFIERELRGASCGS